MDPISNVDQLVMLLRQRLLERSKILSRDKGSSRTAAYRAKTPIDSVRALAAIEGVNDGQLKRALVQNILTDRFGSRLVNDAKFQQVVDRVTETIEQDVGSASLMTRLVGELRASAQ